MIEPEPERPPPPDPDFFDRRYRPLLAPLALYHRFSTRGTENIPRRGRMLWLTSHAAATYYLFLAHCDVRAKTGRIARALGARFWFHLPVGDFWTRMGGVNSSREVAKLLLRDEQLVYVAPGGLREGLQPTTTRFELKWREHRGFAAVALATRSPIVLGTCPRAPDIFTLYRNPLTEYFRRRMKLPLPIFRGLGPTLIPRPVRLTYHLSRPIPCPPIAGEEPSEREVDVFHAEVIERMEAFMCEAAASE